MDNEKRIYGVFDGVGGVGPRGRAAVASTKAAEVVGNNIAHDKKYSSPEKVQEAVRKALEKADKEVHKKVGDGETTTTAAKIWEKEGKQYLIYGHVGDSRLYLARKGLLLKQISVDDSVTTDALVNGKITEDEAERVDQAESRADLRGDEKLESLFKDRHYITGSLGFGDYSIQTGVLEIKPGDKIVLTSDGIHDNLPNLNIGAILNDSQYPAQALMDTAYLYSRGSHYRSKDDDMSAVVVEIPPYTDHFADFPEVAT